MAAASPLQQPPPWRWQADETQPVLPSPVLAPQTGVEPVAAAWKNVTNVVRDDWRPVPLIDLLTNAVRETQYSFQHAGVRMSIRVRHPHGTVTTVAIPPARAHAHAQRDAAACARPLQRMPDRLLLRCLSRAAPRMGLGGQRSLPLAF